MKLGLYSVPVLSLSVLACAEVYNDEMPLEGEELGGAPSYLGTDGQKAGLGSSTSAGGTTSTGGSTSSGGTSASGGSSSGGAASGGSSTGGAASGGSGGGSSSGGAASGGSGGGSYTGNCASPSATSQSNAKCNDTIVFEGSLYRCISQASGVNGEVSGCGTAGVYCSAIAPSNGAWGTTAWELVEACD